MIKNKAEFIIKKNLQKTSVTGISFEDSISKADLDKICVKLTGQTKYDVQFVDNDYEDDFLAKGYNKGRLAILKYNDEVYYISFSEKDIGGRNSSVQSVPTAYNMFYMNQHSHKHMVYYFLNFEGNASTEYQVLMYRLMKTVGVNFINEIDGIGRELTPFVSIDDIMMMRENNAGRNRSNNSTYITKSGLNDFDIYGKTYGANKYETSMMCYAVSKLANSENRLTLYEIIEGDLKELPDSSLEVLKKMNNIRIVPTDMQLEKNVFERENSLRSPRYTFNLLERLGHKHCAFCDCEIPELIQGAHIWPVANIKKQNTLDFDKKLFHALNANNGLWLCENHHKMFDEGLITLTGSGSIVYKDNLPENYIKFMDSVTLHRQLDDYVMSREFLEYLDMRNKIAA